MTVLGRRILLTTDAVGGIWTYTLDLAAGLVAAGAIVRIAVLGPALRADQRSDLTRRGFDAIETGNELDWLATEAAGVRASARAISDLAISWTADLVHLHASAFAAQAFPCPVLVTHHSCVATWWAAVRQGPLPEEFRWRTALAADGLRCADLVLVPSAAFAEAVAGLYGLNAAPNVVRNGRAAEPVDERGIVRDEIFTAGRLWDEGKNIAALDRAAALLAWPVRAAGDIEGPNGARVRVRHVSPLGRISEADMRGCFAGRPIFVSPAKYEPFGLAVLEAAQAGCALVLNEIPTFRELWDGAAVFAEADDQTALCAAIGCLIDDPARRRAIGAAAQDRARRYTLDVMVANTIDAYQSCLGRASDTGAIGPGLRRTA